MSTPSPRNTNSGFGATTPHADNDFLEEITPRIAAYSIPGRPPLRPRQRTPSYYVDADVDYSSLGIVGSNLGMDLAMETIPLVPSSTDDATEFDKYYDVDDNSCDFLDNFSSHLSMLSGFDMDMEESLIPVGLLDDVDNTHSAAAAPILMSEEIASMRDLRISPIADTSSFPLQHGHYHFTSAPKPTPKKKSSVFRVNFGMCCYADNIESELEEYGTSSSALVTSSSLDSVTDEDTSSTASASADYASVLQLLPRR